MTRVLLTGSAGFVGTAFRLYFAGRHDVVADTIDIVGEPIGQPGPPGTFVAADAREFFKAYPTRRYDLAIHCAAIVGGRATIDGQPMAVASDLAIDAEWWQWVLTAKPRTVVYFSSSAAYPTELQTHRERETYRRLREDDISPYRIEHPDAIYGLVKLVGEQQAHHVARALSGRTRVLVARPFSGYGPGQSLDYPVPSIIGRVTRREAPVEVWSDACRDFVYIDDVVGAVIAAVDRWGEPAMTDGRPFVFNVASGVGTSFVQLAQRAAAIAGGPMPQVKVLQGKPTGVWWRVGDPDRMRSFYRLRVPLDEGIARMIG